MARIDVPIERLRFLQTSRRDRWWVAPALTFTVISSFLVYVTWAALQGKYYAAGNYLSPFYSPEIFGNSPHAWFGAFPSWWPSFIPASPALLILPAPAGFRFTCYYYRGAYYKAFWADPPNCAVGEPRSTYRGEHKLPLIVQNLHRFFMYAAVAYLFILAHDAWKGMWFAGPGGKQHFGIGVGTLVLVMNVILLGGYTLGCHSFRHMVGGIMRLFSTSPLRKKVYDCSTCLNRHHMRFAYMSLFGVAFTDIYIRLVSMGIWHDWRIL